MRNSLPEGLLLLKDWNGDPLTVDSLLQMILAYLSAGGTGPRPRVARRGYAFDRRLPACGLPTGDWHSLERRWRYMSRYGQDPIQSSTGGRNGLRQVIHWRLILPDGHVLDALPVPDL